MRSNKIFLSPIFLFLLIGLISCSSDKTKADEDHSSDHSAYEHDGLDKDHKTSYETADHINSSNETEESVPTEVLNSFQNKYVSASNVQWNRQDSIYRASFNRSGKEYTASFEKEGGWTETQSSMDYEQLPQNIKDAFSKNKLQKDSLKEIRMRETADKGKYYDMKFRQQVNEEQGNNIKNVSMNEKGEIQ